jgi:endonuclease/exonuclease/phosphatase family metal-dependent hydrolase
MSIVSPPRAARLSLAAGAAVLSALCVVPATSTAEKKAKTPTLTVMTRNLYLGGDIAGPIPAKTPAEFAQRNSALLGEIAQTDFPARAKLLAKEIGDTKPDLVGLQEVTTIAHSAPGTANSTAPTNVNVVNFLQVLNKALAARGLKYRVASNQLATTVRGPVAQGYDARLSLSDAILVKRRKGLKASGGRKGDFKTSFTVPTAVGPVKVQRGWASVNVSYAKKRFRFVDTHLESFLDGPRVAQAKELIAKGGPARSSGPVVLVGDLNSDQTGRGGNGPGAYKALTGFGFKDAWAQVHGGSGGLSCCHSKLLKDNGFTKPASRIDHLLARGGSYRFVKAAVTGQKTKTPSGLWDSDHGGVVGTLRLGKK